MKDRENGACNLHEGICVVSKKKKNQLYNFISSTENRKKHTLLLYTRGYQIESAKLIDTHIISQKNAIRLG